MPDAPLVEEGDGLEQVLAEPLELVDGERAVLAQFLGEGVVADVLDADDGAAGVGRAGLEGLVEEAGDVRVVERGELLRLPFQAAGGGVVERDLEDALGVVAAVRGDEERLGGRAGAELAEHRPADDLVAGARGQRVLLRVGFRGGEFLLDLVEAPEELADGLGAVGLGELGGVADQGVHRGADGVDDRGREQGAGLGEPGAPARRGSRPGAGR